ncbi:hypothetical protein FQV39_28745 [Bosea sp. F3-2]|uniref:hypothetical protein n=1 Tax=Bosea sp. F3-2 TaxID=2599640 RepID=UPI0011ECBBFA|nr:hypothetical protein [Bosea sp. F3-2]QEL26153.1 hypothetical protein FQV39_28745 [Bosea sp. F3-2]
MSNNGGIIKFRLPTGQNLAIRGSVTRNPARMSAETVANSDGTLDRSFTVQGYRFGMSLADKDVDGNPIDVDALLAFDKVDFTFLHDTERVDYHYGRAHLTGDPQIDAMTGELSGITGAAETYLAVPR